MLWLLMGFLGWLVLLLTKDSRSIKRSLAAGVFAVIIQLLVDVLAIRQNLYTLHNSTSYLLFSVIPIFYTAGMIFSMGTIFAYHLPRGLILKLAHVFIFAFLFWCAEEILQKAGYLVYINWTKWLSLGVNILVFMSLAFLVENLRLRGGD